MEIITEVEEATVVSAGGGGSHNTVGTGGGGGSSNLVLEGILRISVFGQTYGEMRRVGADRGSRGGRTTVKVN